ncbi:MAG: hypothetical protein JST40_01760 [Armatimonadetes bacterium]|nr:hypothetical protein [Armatimonadota bacterium]
MGTTKHILMGVLVLASYNSGATGAREGTLLRVNAQKGDQFRYDCTIAMKIGGPTVRTLNMSFQIIETVSSTTNGKFAYETSFDAAKVSGGGLPRSSAQQVEHQLGQTKGTVVRNSVGKILSNTLGEGVGNGASEIEFPAKPLAPGDKWATSCAIQGFSVSWNHRFLGYETIGGKQTAHLQSVVTQGKNLKTPQPCDSWIEIKSGRPIKQKGTIIASEGGVQSTVSYSVNRK